MLDLVAVREGATVADALAIALRTAQHAESLGFKRYWLAEHHNMAGIASSATAVLVGHIAGGTRTMRVGSGGVIAAQPRAAGGRASSVPWPSCTPAASTWVWAAPRAPTASTMRVAARSRGNRGGLPARRGRTAAAAGPGARRPATHRHAGGGHAGADLAAGLQPVLGAPGGRARTAICLCLALRAAAAVAGAGAVPGPVPPVRHAGQALCGDRRAADRRAHRRRGRVPRQQHLPACWASSPATGSACGRRWRTSWQG